MSYIAAASIGMIGISSLLAWIGFSLKDVAIFQIKDKSIMAEEFRPMFILLSLIFMVGGLVVIRSLILDVGVTSFTFDKTLIFFIVGLLYLFIFMLAFLIIRLVVKMISFVTRSKDVMDTKTL